MQNVAWLKGNYFTAARRHAGGTATTILARARKAKIMVDLAANMLDGQNELFSTVGVKGVSRVKMKQLLRSSSLAGD